MCLFETGLERLDLRETIYCVLRSFKVNLFLEIHFLIATKASFERETKLFNDESVKNILLWSAYMTNFTSLVALIIIMEIQHFQKNTHCFLCDR